MSAASTDADPAAALRLAAADLAKGRDGEAEAALRGALKRAPDHPGLLQLLAIARVRRGDFTEPEELLRRAIALKPDAADNHINLGNVFDARGEHAAAADCFRTALRLDPLSAPALSNLGNELNRLGRRAEALAAYRRAAELKPDNTRYLHNLALAQYELDRFEEAEQGLRRALALDPNFAEAHHNLGVVLESRELPDDAMACYRRAIELDPRHARAMTNLGNLLLAQRKAEESVELQRRAIAADPQLAEAHTNLGAALLMLNRLSESEAAHRRALELKPGLPTALKNLGVLLERQGRSEEALLVLERAVLGGPIETRAEAHFSISFLLLRHGQFKRGWEEYEWRRRTKENRRSFRDFAQPQWRGEEIAGRRILIYPEQGSGDIIHFARYVPMVAARGAKVLLEMRLPLQRLCATLAGVEHVFSEGEKLPAFDLHCPLLSLPLAFGTTPDTIPAAVPYLSADPRETAAWKQRFDTKPRLAVGLVWAGNPEYKNDINRSMDPALLAPLFGIEQASFYSLQVGPSADALASVPGAGCVERLDHALKDFADTAACIEALDLVIAVDTAVAHLAGALGKPVWIMVPFVADFRWMVERTDSPWYPSAQLFRQKTAQDWAGVIERVRQELASRAIRP